MLKEKIGLCGSHRTGKTTLAAEVALSLGIPFLRTSTSRVFAENGLKPSDKMDFSTRIWIQHKIIEEAEKIWGRETVGFITDRTPIDMMAYTLGDIQGGTEVDFVELEAYLDHCFHVTNILFSRLVILQPAIPLVHEKGKASLNKGYIEHLNLLILGLCHDERLQCPVRIIGRDVLSIEARVLEMITNP